MCNWEKQSKINPYNVNLCIVYFCTELVVASDKYKK